AVHLLSPSYTVGAMCVIERADGAVLFVRHSYRPRWGVPGGLSRPGEDVADAARREVAEEAGGAGVVVGGPAGVGGPGGRRGGGGRRRPGGAAGRCRLRRPVGRRRRPGDGGAGVAGDRGVPVVPSRRATRAAAGDGAGLGGARSPGRRGVAVTAGAAPRRAAR